MDRDTELRLIDELIGLRVAHEPFLVERPERSPLSRYTDTAAFEHDLATVFRTRPTILAHASELPSDGAFLTRHRYGTPVLLTRDDDGQVRAFVNVCRHRGATVVRAASGCEQRFRCPYHAWTYSNTGELVAVPERRLGFPALHPSAHGLVPLACEERHGFVWVTVEPGRPIDLDAHLAGLDADLAWLGADRLVVWAVEERTWNTNWKFLVEGGLEAYHFSVAHRDTIWPLFLDNLSTFEVFGPHIRSVLAKRALDQVAELPPAERQLRGCTNVLYSMFPSTALLAQPEHVAVLEFHPVSVDRTLTRIVTLVPPGTDGEWDARQRTKWDRNHRLTLDTFDEDFVLAEEIQRGLASGANTHFSFARFEGALGEFHRIWERERVGGAAEVE